MRAVVYKEPCKVTAEQVEDPRIEQPGDAIIKISTSAICGSDLHMYEGRTAAEPGTVFGHENMGVVEEVGPGTTSIYKGRRSGGSALQYRLWLLLQLSARLSKCLPDGQPSGPARRVRLCSDGGHPWWSGGPPAGAVCRL